MEIYISCIYYICTIFTVFALDTTGMDRIMIIPRLEHY